MSKKIKEIPSTSWVRAGLSMAILLGACSSNPNSSARPATPGEASASVDQGRLKIGDVAPKGRVIDSNGNPLDLASTWADKSSVVVFYRGHW